jgi:hypothetical protein
VDPAAGIEHIASPHITGGLRHDGEDSGTHHDPLFVEPPPVPRHDRFTRFRDEPFGSRQVCLDPGVLKSLSVKEFDGNGE